MFIFFCYKPFALGVYIWKRHDIPKDQASGWRWDKISETSIRRKGRRALIKCAEDPMKLMYPGNKYHIVDDNRSSKPEKKNLV